MRIIFFNIWHGKVWKGLKEFIEKQSDNTDIFCFLEVHPDLEKRLEKILVNYQPIYHEGLKTTYLNEVIEGRSIFAKKGIEIEEKKSVNIYKNIPEDAGGLLYVKLIYKNREFFIGNVHGKAQPGTKIDTPARILQSKRIIDFFKDKNGPVVIGGDFNLNPDTKSIQMFEDAGYKNLIKEYKIENTRNKISWQMFDNIQHFADYAFVSQDIKVKSFEVPYLEVSDHLPLILDIEV